MSEGSRGRGRKGGRPEGGQTGSSPNPGGGGSASPIGWIVSANVVALAALVLAVVALVFNFVEEDEEDGAPVVANPSPTAQASPAAQATPTPVVVAGVSTDDDASMGSEDAAVTIVEFTDYQ
jgi:protein-disulfide isomerase